MWNKFKEYWDNLDIILWALVGATLILVTFMVVTMIQEGRAETFTLTKADWACTMSYTETYTTTMLVGKIMIPQVHTRQVCTEYKRNY